MKSSLIFFIVLCSAGFSSASQVPHRSIPIKTRHNSTFNVQTWKPLDLKHNDEARENFDEIIAQGGNVIVDFYADWCNPCRMMMRTFDTAARDQSLPDVIILKINTDEKSLNSITRRFSFNSIPALFYFKNGKQIKRSGSMSPADFKAFIKQLYA